MWMQICKKTKEPMQRVYTVEVLWQHCTGPVLQDPAGAVTVEAGAVCEETTVSMLQSRRLSRVLTTVTVTVGLVPPRASKLQMNEVRSMTCKGTKDCLRDVTGGRKDAEGQEDQDGVDAREQHV